MTYPDTGYIAANPSDLSTGSAIPDLPAPGHYAPGTPARPIPQGNGVDDQLIIRVRQDRVVVVAWQATHLGQQGG
jgi:hypothetical protein